MRIVLMIILAIFFPCLSHSQGNDLMKDMENNFLQVRQKEGTDNVLKRYLSSADIKEDTIYAFIYVPANCPRCEASFKLFNKWLHEKNRKFLLITVFPDSTVAKYYNKLKAYSADYYIYDVNDGYKDIFSFNNIPLDGSNVLKMTKEGRLITGGDYTVMGSRFVKQLIARREPMPYKTFEHERPTVEKGVNTLIPSNIPEMDNSYKDLKIESENVPLCKLTRMPYFINNALFYPDDIINGVLIFNTNGGKLKLEKIARVDSVGKCAFVNVGKDLYNNYLSSGMVFDMVCNTNLIDSTNIGISYSLPKLFYQNGDSTHVAYYNQACIVSVPLGMNADQKLYPLNFNLENEKFFYKHFQFSFIGDKVIIGCQKLTWPMEYESSDYKDDVNRNSFHEEFYENENPYMAAFDKKSGNVICRFGNLENSAKKTLTGYYFVSPLSEVCGKELIYTDGFSGKVYVCDTSNISKSKECFEAFKLNDCDFPKIDTTRFYTYEYVKPYSKLYSRCIKDMRITKNKLYCIVSYGDNVDNTVKERYTFLTIDRRTRETKEVRFPQNSLFYSFGYGLRTLGQNNVSPFVILKSGNEAFVRIYNDD